MKVAQRCSPTGRCVTDRPRGQKLQWHTLGRTWSRTTHSSAARPWGLISVRHSATRIILPHAVCIIESGGIADRSGISVRRVNADPESKTGAIISSAAVISATAVKRAATAKGAPAIEPARGCGECAAAAHSSMSSTESCMASAESRMATAMAAAAATSRERRHRTEGCHRNNESNRSEHGPNQLQECAFHNYLQTTPL